MRRSALAITTVAAVLAAPAAASAGPQPAAPAASCVALITSYEASQLSPGSVGREVSGLAAGGPGLGRILVSALAQSHLGSLEGCSDA
jgi:hypothetical protein